MVHVKMVIQVVKAAPFVWAAFTVLRLMIGGEVCDSLFYASPFAGGILLLLSKALELCRWHRAEIYLLCVPDVAGDSWYITVAVLVFSAFNAWMARKA